MSYCYHRPHQRTRMPFTGQAVCQCYYRAAAEWVGRLLTLRRF